MKTPLPAIFATASRTASSRVTRQTRCFTPRSSTESSSGAAAIPARSAPTTTFSGSEKRPKIGLMCASVARIRESRSAFGPVWVRSWGNTSPSPKGDNLSAPRNPFRTKVPFPGMPNSCS